MLNKDNGGFPLFNTYQDPFNQFINSNLDLNATRVSFFDVLENGYAVDYSESSTLW